MCVITTGSAQTGSNGRSLVVYINTNGEYNRHSAKDFNDGVQGTPLVVRPTVLPVVKRPDVSANLAYIGP